MRRICCATLAAVALVGLASVATAADMPVKAPVYKAAPVVAAPNWTGWYLGLNAGGGWENTIHNSVTSNSCFAPLNCGFYGTAFANAVPGQFDDHPHGFIGGGQIGYNYQTGAFVLGIETDFQGADINGAASASNTVSSTPLPVTVAGTGSQKIDWFGTLRGRVGWLPVNSLLVYATGGLAYGHVLTDVAFSGNLPGIPRATGSIAMNNSTTRAGWTVGGGLEWMFAPNWTVRGEYLYYDLGDVTLNSTLNINAAFVPPVLVTTVGIQSAAHYHGSIARVGVNYKFW